MACAGGLLLAAAAVRRATPHVGGRSRRARRHRPCRGWTARAGRHLTGGGRRRHSRRLWPRASASAAVTRRGYLAIRLTGRGRPWLRLLCALCGTQLFDLRHLFDLLRHRRRWRLLDLRLLGLRLRLRLLRLLRLLGLRLRLLGRECLGESADDWRLDRR